MGLEERGLDPEEDRELAGAVDPGRVQQVIRHRQEELAEHKDAGGREERTGR